MIAKPKAGDVCDGGHQVGAAASTPTKVRVELCAED